MTEKDMKIISELKKRIPDDIRKHMKRLIVYGSRARGEAAEDWILMLLSCLMKKIPQSKKSSTKLLTASCGTLISNRLYPEGLCRGTIQKSGGEGILLYGMVEQEGISL